LVLPLTSGVAAAASSALRGAQMAADDVNAERVVRLVLVPHDDGGSPQKAIDLFQRLSQDAGVAAVVGALTDMVAVQLSSVASATRTPLVSPGATGPIPFAGEYFFRTALPSSVQGRALAEYALRKGLRQASVVQDTNEYGTAVVEGFSQAMRSGGGVVLSQHLFTDGTRDFAPVVRSLQRERPQAVLFAGYPDEGAVFVQQLAQAGVHVPLLVPDSFASEEAAAALSGREAVVASVFFADSPFPRVRAFVREYRTRYGRAPDAFAAQAYDAVRVVAVAVKRLGPAVYRAPDQVDRVRLRDVLAGLRDYPGVTGTITFDRLGNPARDVQLLRVDSGKLVVLP
jgi:branched-chain amino acid transport system substrate-binding protein